MPQWTQINIDEAPKYPVISQKIPALFGPNCKGQPNKISFVELKFESERVVEVCVAGFTDAV